MTNVLIIKLGALGDVVRTTPLLRVLEGNITWVTAARAVPLLDDNPYIDRILCIEDGPEALLGHKYDLVINLEDEPAAAKLASRFDKATIVGAYMGEHGVTYSESASAWFDMSLISRFGKAKADELKMSDRKTFQEFMFAMIGRLFRGEEYVLNAPVTKLQEPNLVGLEARAGDVWPMKRWSKFDELALRLEQAGFKTKVFQQRERLLDYMTTSTNANTSFAVTPWPCT